MPRFQDYEIPRLYSGAVKPPDFGKLSQYEGTDLRCYGGEPADYAQKKINFAGHFIIDSCTCGSECRYFFMWDASNGKVYGRLPPGVIAGYGNLAVQKNIGATYRVDSSLLIVDGCVEDTCDCATRYYRWNGRTFDLIRRRASLLSPLCQKTSPNRR